MRGFPLVIASAVWCSILTACASSGGPQTAARATDVRVYRPDTFPERDYEVLAELDESEPVGVQRNAPSRTAAAKRTVTRTGVVRMPRIGSSVA